MAKGKPSRAFLEALQQQKRRNGDEKAGGGFTTPDWFFKKDAAPASTPASTPEPTHAPTAAPTPSIPLQSFAGPMVSKKRALKLTWKHGALAGVVIVVGVGLSYLAMREEAPPKLGPSGEQVRADEPNREVLQPAPRSAAAVQPPAPRPAPVPPAMANAAGAVQERTAASGAAPVAMAPAAASAGRVVGLNYVIFTGFPKDQEKLASEAAAALNAAGIGATVEQGIAGYSWFTVVGTTGFTRISTPDYHEYLRKTEAVSHAFAGNVRWKRFQPVPRKWQ